MNRTRAGLLALAALGIGLLMLFTRGQRGYEPLEPFTLAIAADTHYIAPELTDGGAYFTRIVENGDGKAMQYCEEITDAFAAQIVSERPDALILAGDLSFNGARRSHEALAEKLRTIENAGIPVLVIPGNHDLNSPTAACFRGDSYSLTESVDAAAFETIYRDFGYGEALARDESSLSYVAELSPQLWALMLDVNTAEAPGSLLESTRAWVRGRLAEAKRRGVRVLAVSHQNLLAHNSLFSYGFVFDGNEELLALYEKYGVLCNLSGHMHLQHIAKSAGGLTDLCTSALMTAPNQYGLLRLEGDSLRYCTQQLDYPHAEQAGRFLWELAFRQAQEELPEPREELCRFFAQVNTAYLAGRCDELDWDEAAYEQIREQGSFLMVYLQSILDDGLRDHTSWELTA